MRALTAAAGIFLTGVGIVVLWALITNWNTRRSDRYLRQKAFEQEAVLATRYRMYAGWDGAIDTIEYILVKDETGLFLTGDERERLRAHVREFNHFQQGATG